MDDDMIIDLYLAKDERAIKETSLKYSRLLLSLSNKILNDRETARECENDTYLKTWNAIPPKEPREHFSAFLCTIIRHLSLDKLRMKTADKRGSEVRFSEEMENCIPDALTPKEEFDRAYLEELMNRFVSTLDHAQRMVFVRRYFFMDSLLEISLKTGYSVPKIKSMLFRLRGQLKEVLEKEGYQL